MSDPTAVVEVMALATLKPYPGNPRRGDVSAIADSVAEFDQMEPLLIQRSTGYILAGNHTRLALLAEGFTEAQVVVIDVTDAVARAVLAADNRHHDLGTYDLPRLLANLEALQEAAALAGTGYDADDVDDLADRLGALPTLEAQPFTGGYGETDEEFAARASKAENSRAADTPQRPLLLLFNADEHTEYLRLTNLLRERWAETQASAVVARVLHSVAASVTY